MRLTVPTGAGSATDVMARLLAEGLSRTLGQPVVVENQPGASGILAHQTVARATADGYTLLFTNTSGLAVNPVTFKTLPYNPERDFTAIAMVSNLGPQMISVNADVPVRTLPELVAYANKIPASFRSATTTPRARRPLQPKWSTGKAVSGWLRCRIAPASAGGAGHRRRHHPGAGQLNRCGARRCRCRQALFGSR